MSPAGLRTKNDCPGEDHQKFTRPIDRPTRFRAKFWILILPNTKHSANHSTARNDESVCNIIRRMNEMWRNNWINGWNEGRFKAKLHVWWKRWHQDVKPCCSEENNVPVNLFISYKHFLRFHGIIYLLIFLSSMNFIIYPLPSSLYNQRYEQTS